MRNVEVEEMFLVDYSKTNIKTLHADIKPKENLAEPEPYLVDYGDVLFVAKLYLTSSQEKVYFGSRHFFIFLNFNDFHQ